MLTQQQIVEALLKPEAYDEDPGLIELIQTHISFVFLTKHLVYKVKKAVNFGFLDFSTLEKRHFFCNKELELNRRLCPDMYLEVVPITKSKVIKIKGLGPAVEYAVKMKRMPQERMMNKLLELQKVDKRTVDRIASIIAKFHSKIEPNTKIGGFGLDPIVEANWQENFDQTVEFIDRTISREDYQLVSEKIGAFIKVNLPLFAKRMKEGKVKNCHGDIHSGNIFITKRIYIFDAIEFNDRISYSDVAADVGFLAMDLDFKKRTDLSRFFIQRYIKYSGDQELEKLLQFYKCYRAYVRGKVISLKLKDPNVGDGEKDEAAKEARAYFDLASDYAKNL